MKLTHFSDFETETTTKSNILNKRLHINEEVRGYKDFESLGSDTYVPHVTYFTSLRSRRDKKPVKTSGTSIRQYFEHLIKADKMVKRYQEDVEHVIYFHNLDYDLSFILWYLHQTCDKFVLSERLTELKVNEACLVTLYTGLMNSLMSAKLWFRYDDKHTLVVHFYDSYQRLPLSLAKIGELIGHDKLDNSFMDTSEYGIWEKPSLHMQEYAMADSDILRESITRFSPLLHKLTVASSSLAHLKRMIGGERTFKLFFPPNEHNQNIRKFYMGGLVLYDIAYRNKSCYVLSFDVNSLYPFVASTFALPQGLPTTIHVSPTDVYKMSRKLQKDGKLFLLEFNGVQLWKKGNNMLPFSRLFAQPENNLTLRRTLLHLKAGGMGTHINSMTTVEELYKYSGLTNFKIRICSPEYDLFMRYYSHYDISNVVFTVFDGGGESVLKQYYDTFYHLKQNAQTKAEREVYKLFLNGLTGKFAQDCEHPPKYISELTPTGPKYKEYTTNDSEYIYPAMSVFITSQGRRFLLESIEKVHRSGGKVVYTDTDSMKVSGLTAAQLNKILSVDLNGSGERGLWEFEGEGEFKYLRQKAYVFSRLGQGLKIACSGMQERVKRQFIESGKGIEDFNLSLRLPQSQLKRKKVFGGTMLYKTDFELIETGFVSYPEVNISMVSYKCRDEAYDARD